MKLKLAMWVLCVVGIGAAVAAEPEYLRIMGTDTQFVVKGTDGKDWVIRRTLTPCAKNKGWLQPLVPVPGVHPVGEIEVLQAMNDPDALLVDMREPNDRVDGTIPGSKHIVYTEVAGRMDELGCKKLPGKWDCAAAKKVVAFCNGPVCPQSPSAIVAMTRACSIGPPWAFPSSRAISESARACASFREKTRPLHR
jgi:rhodanese-related sulfurtransferase